jgi:NAD(P) transhydrogenase subunit beta
MNNMIQLIYIATAVLLILGLRKMSLVKTAKSGINLAGWGMLAAILVTFFVPEIKGNMNYALMVSAILVGTLIGWYSGKKVVMTHMPQMIALYNGMGGGAASAIAAIELMRAADHSPTLRAIAVISAIIGTLSFSGSLIAFAKLQDLMKRVIVLPQHQLLNIALLIASAVLGGFVIFAPTPVLLLSFFSLLMILGVTFTIPIGGANMPVVISLFNAMTGLAVGLEGYVLDNSALVIAGIVVGSSGTLLTQLMAKAMNKTVASILFTAPSATSTTLQTETDGSLKPIEINDAAIMMAYAKKVLIVPGYGMAVAQAQHKIWELVQELDERGVTVKFAIHPVAGRMPGHMNVLLAEAGVPYDKLLDLDEVNPEFPTADVTLVIGANDVVNPSALTDTQSPIYGMPILNAAQSRHVLVVKRGQGKGFSGVENSLFTMDNVRMLYGDGQDVINKLVHSIKAL